jgi:hypothetical protein
MHGNACRDLQKVIQALVHMRPSRAQNRTGISGSRAISRNILLTTAVFRLQLVTQKIKYILLKKILKNDMVELARASLLMTGQFSAWSHGTGYPVTLLRGTPMKFAPDG